MAESGLSPAEVLLLAVKLSVKADLDGFRKLAAQYSRVLRLELILRILLTYLPETVEPSDYVPILLDLRSGKLWDGPSSTIDVSILGDVTKEDATRRARQLHLLPLLWPNAPKDAPEDHLIQFLIHRAYKIDEETGLLTQLPPLLTPFLDESPFLRSWMITTILPLLRLEYEYHPQDSVSKSLQDFETLDDWAGVNLLLSRTSSEHQAHDAIGRDLRGLVGPWLYGNNRSKRRRITKSSELEAQNVSSLVEPVGTNFAGHAGWEEVFKWIMAQASKSWPVCVNAIDQWDGPGDDDLGGYENSSERKDEGEERLLQIRYARTAFASAYTVPEANEEALSGIQRLLMKMIRLLDCDRIPPLQAAAALLSPVPPLHTRIINDRNASFLRTELLDEMNPLTTPDEGSITFLHALLLSAFILTRGGCPCNIRRAGELALIQDERDQTQEFKRLIANLGNGPKSDDKYWIRVRNEILWLRDWGSERTRSSKAQDGRGIFGKLKSDLIERELLRVLLLNTRYTLARSIYDNSAENLLSKDDIQKIVISAAMNAFDNATNPNKTRGGVKKCDEILKSFPDLGKDSILVQRAITLVDLTHAIGNYRLVLKSGEPLAPIALRTHGDAIAIIGKILAQNPKSYSKVDDLLEIGEKMVKAGLLVSQAEEGTPVTATQEEKLLNDVKRRVTGLCIDAALSEDDFETAYSFVMNRVSPIADLAQEPVPSSDLSSSMVSYTGHVNAQPPPKVIDDWSWRAALQAGKYRLSRGAVLPTHLGNSSANPEIRHLQQRMDCLSVALRVAPPSTLHEILNVFRRCEEELDTKLKEEAEQEDEWDHQGDKSGMPGGFASDAVPKPIRSSALRGAEEGPMSLFDLTRAGAAHAQRSLSSISGLGGPGGRNAPTNGSKKVYEGPKLTQEGEDRVRKRDQLRDAAVGTLASGIGWLINAPPPVMDRSGG